MTTEFPAFPAARTAILAALLLVADGASAQTQTSLLRVTNQCPYPIWIQQDDAHRTNDPVVVPIAQGASYDYSIPEAGLASTRFWAKAACDSKGWNCGIGESVGVSNAVSGGDQTTQTVYDSPIDSKFEATWGCQLDDSSQCALNPSNQQPLPATTSWDASAVDGYTFAYTVLVKNDPNGSCTDQGGKPVTKIDCSGLDVGQCPTGEDLSSAGTYPEINGIAVSDLSLAYGAYTDTSKVVGCFSPCTLLTSGQWLGRSEQFGNLTPESDQAQLYCCPTAAGEPWSVSPQQCSSTGKTIGGTPIPAVAPKTNYVNTVHEVCNSYAYAYDDGVGAVNCAATVQYEMVFCPSGTGPELPPQRQPATFCNPQLGDICPGGVACPTTEAACGADPTMCRCPSAS
ncbi:hypothetical protein KXS07_08425 [Inquilinus limosus]|uniref:hypothetical protein n=1 Tax=Inquilinus limosus TaxID=171674 RepID=UPI003F163183